MPIPTTLICQSCRRYGVKLLDNLCEPCYTLSIPVRTYRPGNLPRPLFDPKQGHFRNDIGGTIADKSEEFRS